MQRHLAPINFSQIGGQAPDEDSQLFHSAREDRLSEAQNSLKIHTRSHKILATINTEERSSINEKNENLNRSIIDKFDAPSRSRAPYLDKITFGRDLLLKDMEYQRGSLKNKQQHSLLHEISEDSFRQNKRTNNHESKNAKPKDTQEEKIFQKYPSKPEKPGITNKFPNTNRVNIRKFDLEFGNIMNSSINSSNIFSAREGPASEYKKTTNKYGRFRFPPLHPSNQLRLENGAEKGRPKLNLNLILALDEKLWAILENYKSKQKLAECVKNYLELMNNKEIINVEDTLSDTKTRRNVKTYIMLEKTCAFTVLLLLMEEINPKESQEMHIYNLCHYMYSNFVNFVSTILGKIGTEPGFDQIPGLEILQGVGQRQRPELDRSFNLEQLNKFLLRVLRGIFKQNLIQGERLAKLDLLLEKIEFGLMLNYYTELKTIFWDAILKHNVNLSSDSILFEDFKRGSNQNKNKLYGSSNAYALNKVQLNNNEFYLPPISKTIQGSQPIYSLVLDMDETLIHYDEIGGKARFNIRPYAELFLQKMSQIYEIIIFTAGTQEYADKILNMLDPEGLITHRLYRQHITFKPNTPGICKDLSKLGRDLSKTIIIDNCPDNFVLQPDNGIEIKSWYNDPFDKELLNLIPFLTDLVANQTEDVAKAIKKFKENLRTPRY